MKVKELLLMVSLVGASAIPSLGQINCTNSTKLVCELPIASSNLVPANAPAALPAAQAASTPINAAIATQLTQLAIPSATSGVVALREAGSQVGIPYDNLGPILTDRPETVGKGHLYASFSYQHFNFNSIDGIGLGSLPFAYTFTLAPVNNNTQTYFGSTNNNVGFKLDQYVMLFTYGATKTTDVSLVVPINSVSLDVTTSDFKTYVYNSLSNSYTNASSTIPSQTTFGSASGLGDILLGIKQYVYGSEGSRTAVSAGLIVRFPSGDYLNLLGSGAYGVNLYGIVSYRARISPHFKISNQWNGTSPLVNPTGASGVDSNLPGGVGYDIGLDARIKPYLTFAMDALGSQFVNSPSIVQSTLVLTPTPTNESAPLSLPGVTALSHTYTTANLSLGLKWRPKPALLVFGNVLISMHNVGLRSDPVPLAGISYNFNLKR